MQAHWLRINDECRIPSLTRTSIVMRKEAEGAPVDRLQAEKPGEHERKAVLSMRPSASAPFF
jgi:hypothetical protein